MDNSFDHFLLENLTLRKFSQHDKQSQCIIKMRF